ncbi:MAG: S-layer homology domain-containing protein [Kineothrix sp.]
MKKGLLATIISFVLLVFCFAAEANAAAAEEPSGFKAEKRYIIYSGTTETALFDDGGNAEGWLRKGTYNPNAQKNDICKYWWDIEGTSEGYYLTNVGTGFPVKGEGRELDGKTFVVSDKGDGSSKGYYIFEQSGDGYRIKSQTNGKYMKYGVHQNYITFTDAQSEATVWTVQEVHSRLEGSMYLWKGHPASDYFRIPAIAAANNGDLLAVTDIRYDSNSDLGNKQIDIAVKKSVDNGTAWSAETNLTQGHSRQGYGFGDAGLVADRDSDKVLILCATGTRGFWDSTRDNPLMVSSILSENNGDSFSAPEDLTSSIYGLKDDWISLFVASGRIMQSRYIKTGEHYRIYTAILIRPSGSPNDHDNYVLYSDDFGETWNILGGSASSPVPAGDEAKIEELPDGSVVISSRKTNGRFINIFNYDKSDPSFTSGSWGTAANLTLGAGQSTNGEIYVLYVKDTNTGDYKYLVLQSVPTIGNSRKGVGIFYRELGSSDNQISSFVSGWDQNNFYMVQNGQSGYSTMTVQKDGTIGFLYEDSPTWYDIVYLNLDLRTITNNKYEMAFRGIGSAKSPYQVETEEQARAVLEVYGREGVHWNFTGEALEYIRPAISDISGAVVSVGERLTLESPQVESVINTESLQKGWEIKLPGTEAWVPFSMDTPIEERHMGAELRYAVSSPYMTSYSNSILIENAFTAVADITGIPTEIPAGTETSITASVTPAEATNKEVLLEAVNPGDTQTVVKYGQDGEPAAGRSLLVTPKKAGTLVIRATVAGGSGADRDFTKEFSITVTGKTEPEPPVEKLWPFSDVKITAGNWKYESVKYVYNNQIMNGISGTAEFQPDHPLTRAMFATVLYRMAGKPEVAFTDKFSDVAADKWYSDAIIWANRQNIVSGFTDGSYGINTNITREQIAKMLYEYAKSCKYDITAAKELDSFTDAASVSRWAADYMKWATAVEMITGKPNAEGGYRLDPKGEATRAECAAMLMRFENKYK